MTVAAVDVTLWAHVAAGFVALLAGPVAMASAKGGPLHRSAGRTYAGAMAAVVATAVVLSLVDLDVFLLGIAVFSFFLTFTGYRSLYRKGAAAGAGVAPLDRAVALATLLFSAGLLVRGALAGFAVLPLFFGVLGVFLVVQEVRGYRRPRERNAWLFDHITGMLAAYIATFTAFAVTNATFLPTTLVWLAPTVIGTVAISLTIRRYRRALARGAAPGDVVRIEIARPENDRSPTEEVRP